MNARRPGLTVARLPAVDTRMAARPWLEPGYPGKRAARPPTRPWITFTTPPPALRTTMLAAPVPALPKRVATRPRAASGLEVEQELRGLRAGRPASESR